MPFDTIGAFSVIFFILFRLQIDLECIIILLW